LFKKRRNKTHYCTVTEGNASGIIKTNDQYTVYSTVNGILKKMKCCKDCRARSVAFELESKIKALKIRIAYQLSQGNSLYIKDKIAEMG
jgi:hypothetical protein